LFLAATYGQLRDHPHHLTRTHSSLERAPLECNPLRVRNELSELIRKQIDAIEKETFGGATDVERREYEDRRKRIDELYDQLQHFNAAA
jgi:hypothetical protein